MNGGEGNGSSVGQIGDEGNGSSVSQVGDEGNAMNDGQIGGEGNALKDGQTGDKSVKKWLPIPAATGDEEKNGNGKQVSFVPFSIRGRRPSQNFRTSLTPIFE